jgi:flagellar motility protein MotE (MotC chaperone)
MSELNMPQGNSGSQGSDGQQKAGGLISGILAVLVALIVVALVFAGVFFFFVKTNLFQMGDRFRGTLETRPMLRWMLPEQASDYDPEAAENLTPLELRERYTAYRTQVDSLEETVSTLSKDVADLTARNEALAATEADTADQTQQQEEALAVINRQKEELRLLSLEIANGLATGDTEGFKAYFEKLDPQAAAEAYANVLATEAADAQSKQAARPFELMDREKAADVMRELWTKDKQLLLSIMDANKPQTLAEILANMEATLAADITRNLADYRKAKLTPATAGE